MTFIKIAALCLCLSGLAFGEPPKDHVASISSPGNSMEILTAKVEKVFAYADEAGFQFIAYQVSYKGHSVIVQDPIGSTNTPVGGEIRFLAVRHDMTTAPKSGKKIVSFVVTKQQA